MLIFSLWFVPAYTQMGICYNAYIWTFSTNQMDTDENMPDAEAVTIEFESLLSQRYDFDCHLLQRRYLADLQEQIESEKAITEVKGIAKNTQDSLKHRGAEVVVLGKIEKRKDNKVYLLVSFNALQDEALLMQEFRLMPRSSWEDDAVRRDTLNHIIDRLLRMAYRKGGTFTQVENKQVSPTANPIEMPTNPEKLQLSGNFSFWLKNGGAMPVTRLTTKAPIIGSAISNKAALGIYRMKQGYHSGTEYQMFLTQKQAAYTYIIGSDLKTGDLYDLFPLQGQSPYLQQGERNALPPDNYIRLDNTIGIDYMCIVTSPESLDMEQIKASIQNRPGSFAERVTTALKGKLATANEVVFDPDNLAFQSVGNEPQAVVMIVEIEHLK